jgi:DNA-dependent RNA polymerase auxiliary subunit epsilon
MYIKPRIYNNNEFIPMMDKNVFDYVKEKNVFDKDGVREIYLVKIP